MSKFEQPGDISPLVRRWMPEASEDALVAATANFRCYIEMLYRIFRRLEAEGRFPLERDNPDVYAMLETPNQTDK